MPILRIKRWVPLLLPISKKSTIYILYSLFLHSFTELIKLKIEKSGNYLNSRKCSKTSYNLDELFYQTRHSSHSNNYNNRM